MNGQSFDVARVKTGRTLIWDYRGAPPAHCPNLSTTTVLISWLLFHGFRLGGGAVQAPALKWGGRTDWSRVISGELDRIQFDRRAQFTSLPIHSRLVAGRQIASLSPLLPRLSLLSAGVCCFASQLPPVASQNLKTEGGANSLCFSIWGHQQWRSDCTQSKTWWSYSELGWYFCGKDVYVVTRDWISSLGRCWKNVGEKYRENHPWTPSQDVLPQNSLTHLFF